MALAVLFAVAACGEFAIPPVQTPQDQHARIKTADQKPHQKAEGADGPDERIALYTFWLMVFTGVLSGVAVAQVFFLFRADKTAGKAAEAALLQARAAEAAGRAWIFFYDTKEAKWGGADTYKIWWENIGDAPAVVTGLRLACHAADEPPDPKTAPLVELPAGAIVGRAGKWQRGRVFKRDFDSDFQKGELVYLYGEIIYRDAIGENRASWFCRRYTGDQFILDDLTDWSLNGYR